VSIAAGRSGTIAFEVLETVRLLSTHAEALNGDVGSWRISAAAEWWQEPLMIIVPCQQPTFKDILPSGDCPGHDNTEDLPRRRC